MSVRVKLSQIMRKDADWKHYVESDEKTPEKCMADVLERYPGLRKWIYNKHGELLEQIQFSINEEMIYENELGVSLNDGDEFFIFLNIGGG